MRKEKQLQIITAAERLFLKTGGSGSGDSSSSVPNVNQAMYAIANVQNRIKGIAAGFQAKGMAPNVALKTAQQMMDGSLSVQATILTYMDIFQYIGCMFLVCVPLVLFFIKK